MGRGMAKGKEMVMGKARERGTATAMEKARAWKTQ
jgi:hypothetical protein